MTFTCPNPKCQKSVLPPEVHSYEHDYTLARMTKWWPCSACGVQVQVSAFRRSLDFTWSSFYVVSWRDARGAWHDGPDKQEYQRDFKNDREKGEAS